jgi:uncharacterized protein (DUF1330 family)
MPAFILVEIDIHDKAAYEEYKKLAPDTIKMYDGKFVIRGGKSEPLEGNWKPERIVMLQFPTVERAKEWWSSAAYEPAKKIRQSASSTKMLVIEGYE